MILCVGTTPAVQRVMRFRGLRLDAVNRAVRATDGAAGKSINVAKVLHALGERPLATGFLGGDRGAFVRELLAARGLELDFVTVQARTRQCVTVIDETAGTVTELVEESPPAAAADFAALRAVIQRRLPDCRAVVLSGTVAPGGPPDFYGQITRLAREADRLVVVDAQGGPLRSALAERPDLVKPNRAELAATVGHALPDETAVRAALRQLLSAGARRGVVTDGAGPVLAAEAGATWRLHPPAITAGNPIGSGDAFTAGLIGPLLRGAALPEACRQGIAAGAANALGGLAGELDPEVVAQLAPRVRIERLPN